MSNQWISRDVQQKRAAAERMHHMGTLAARAWLHARPSPDALDARLRAERARVGPEALAWVAVLSEAFQRLSTARTKASQLRAQAQASRDAADAARAKALRVERHAATLEEAADAAEGAPLYDQRGLPKLNAVQREEVWRAAEEAEQAEAREWAFYDANPYEPEGDDMEDPYWEERIAELLRLPD